MTTPQGAAAPSERDTFVRCARVEPKYGPSIEVDFDAPGSGESAWLRLYGSGLTGSAALSAEQARTIGEALLRAHRQLSQRAATAALLERSAEKAAARRFTGEPITGFGAL